jgi:hypothetical protein
MMMMIMVGLVSRGVGVAFRVPLVMMMRTLSHFSSDVVDAMVEKAFVTLTRVKNLV